MLKCSAFPIFNISLFILVILKYTVFTYNFDVNNVKIFDIPKSLNHKRGSYFGFSTAFYTQGKDSILLVGAPRANATAMQYAYEPGNVYTCRINGVCTEWNIDMNKKFNTNRISNVIQNKNSVWIGATIAVEKITDPKIVICSPRWTYDSNTYTPGVCYLIKVQNITTFNVKLESRISTYKNPVLHTSWDDIQNRQDGFSLHLVHYKYTSGTSLIISSPVRHPLFTLVSDSFKSQQHITPDIRKRDTYFGYAVTSGCYFKKEELWYATGGPRANLTGKVMLIEHRHTKNIKFVQGEQIGEYFGASLTSCDLNNDGKDELIVGAPHWTKDVDEGRIYIFNDSPAGLYVKAKIEGQTPEGRFGSVITCLGDINSDGYADFAVGAPYEHGTGAIYIYSGDSNGLYTHYSQKILGTQFGTNVRGFGISISEPWDINADKYPDIAVGAYLSEQTIVIKSKPVVVITTKLDTKHKVLLHNSTEFFIQECTSYEGKNPPKYLQIVKFLTIDELRGRAFYNKERNDNIYKISSTLNHTKTCETYKINLKKNIINLLDPLEISISITLDEDLPSKNVQLNKINSIFCTSCASINKAQSQTKYSIKLPFVLDCGEDNICQSDVKITLSTNLVPENRYTIGSKSDIQFTINAHNHGEPAYQTKVHVYIPGLLSLVNIPPSCTEGADRNNTSEVICDIGNPLRKNETLILLLVMTDTVYNINQIEITANLTMQSEQKKPLKTYSLIIDFDTDVNIKITGKAQDLLYSYIHHEKHQLSIIQFEHIYEVQKFGISPIEEVILIINIPTYWKDSTGDIQIIDLSHTSGYMNGQPFYCTYSNFTNSTFRIEEFKSKNINFSMSLPPTNRTLYLNCSNTNIQCTHLECRLGPFIDFLSAKLSLTLDLYLQNFTSTMLEGKDIIFFVSSGSANIEEKYVTQKYKKKFDNSTIVATTFLGSPISEPLASWIIVLSISFGIILLVGLILVLSTIGFFKRKKREELNTLISKINNEQTTLNANSNSEDLN